MISRCAGWYIFPAGLSGEFSFLNLKRMEKRSDMGYSKEKGKPWINYPALFVEENLLKELREGAVSSWCFNENLPLISLQTLVLHNTIRNTFSWYLHLSCVTPVAKETKPSYNCMILYSDFKQSWGTNHIVKEKKNWHWCAVNEFLTGFPPECELKVA